MLSNCEGGTAGWVAAASHLLEREPSWICGSGGEGEWEKGGLAVSVFKESLWISWEGVTSLRRQLKSSTHL